MYTIRQAGWFGLVCKGLLSLHMGTPISAPATSHWSHHKNISTVNKACITSQGPNECISESHMLQIYFYADNVRATIHGSPLIPCLNHHLHSCCNAPLTCGSLHIFSSLELLMNFMLHACQLPTAAAHNTSQQGLKALGTKQLFYCFDVGQTRCYDWK